MSTTAQREAVKRSLGGEGAGAIVELDIRKLNKEQLIQLGMKTMLDKYTGLVRRGLMNAEASNNPALMTAIGELFAMLCEDHSKIVEDFTRSAMQTGAAKMNELRQ